MLMASMSSITINQPTTGPPPMGLVITHSSNHYSDSIDRCNTPATKGVYIVTVDEPGDLSFNLQCVIKGVLDKKKIPCPIT